MSVDSPAEVIPFERFLECRDRRRRIAAATGTAVMPASTDLRIQPELTERALTMLTRHGASAIGSSTHEKAASTPRPTESRTAGPARSADPRATRAPSWVGSRS
jgi:hypothetical protein